MEETLNEFNQWCSSELASQDAENNGKRKYVPMTQESYTGTAKRVYNTFNMP